jgi:SAM-dependent methyltransferase
MGLAGRGYLVTGLDRSAALIAEAQKRVSTTDLPVAFAVGEILALPFSPPFDGILCRGVLNDLLDEHSRQEVFFSFARTLRPGGVLILDVREWHATARRKTREPVAEKSVDTTRGKLTFRSVTQLDHDSRQLRVAERHTLQKDGVETVAVYGFRMRCWTQEELHRHLTRAGFHALVYLGDYDGAAPLGASDRMVSIASRT